MKKNTLSIVIILLLFISNNGFSQNKSEYLALLIPKEMSAGAHSVVRQDDVSIEVKGAGLVVEKVFRVVTILDEESPETNFILGYDSQSSISNLSLKIYDVTGKLVRKLTKEEIIDRGYGDFSGYTDNRFKFADMRYGVTPYTIEIAYTKTNKGTFGHTNLQFQRFEQGVMSSKVSYTTPKQIPIKYKMFNSNVLPSKTEYDTYTTYEWFLEKLTPIKREELMTNSFKVLPFLQISPATFQYQQYTGSMQSWEDFGNFLYALNKDRDKVSPNLAQEIGNLTANAKNDIEKINILYKYMQKKMRYVSIQLGIGGWQTFEAQHVEKNKYGDCKALSNFMKAMLNEVGIASNLAVIERDDNPDFEPEEAFCANTFNHAILYLPSQNMWLECTSNSLPTGFLDRSTQNRKALILKEKGSHLLATPTYSAKENHSLSKMHITLDDAGNATIKESVTLKNLRQGNLRDFLQSETIDKLKESYQRSSSLAPFTFTQFEVKPDEVNPIVEMSATIQATRFASKAGTRLFVPLNKHNPFESELPNNEQRKHGIKAGDDGYWEEDEVQFVLPEGYDIESLPPLKSEFSSPYGHYSLHITQQGKEIAYKRSLLINSVELAADKYKELRDFYKQIQQADAAKMVLKKKP